MANLAQTLRQVGYVTPQGQVTGPNAPLAQQLKNYVTNVIPTAAQNLAQQRSDIDAAITMGQNGIQVGDREAFERQMAQVPNLMGSVNLPRKAILEKQFNKTQELNPSFLGDDLFEQGVKQVEFDDGNAYARFLKDNKGNIRLLTLEAENSPNVRGRQILNWLKDTYKKPIQVNEVDIPAAGYWDKMQKEGLIQGWSHKMYDGKIIE
jgi:hypothetical protein